jgi:hypothetical protein
VVPYQPGEPDATSLRRDTIDHPPLIRGTRAEVLVSIGRYQPPRKKPRIPPSSMRIPCEDHGHEAPYDSAHREKNRLPDLGNIIQLGDRVHSIAHSIRRTVLPLSLHLFCLCRLVSCCHKTGSAVTARCFSERPLSQVHQLTHSQDAATVSHGIADYNSPSTNTIDHLLLSHMTSTKPEPLQSDSNLTRLESSEK